MKECEDEEVASPRPQPTAFTIDLDEGKVIDTHKYENLVRKSQARHRHHRRVHSTSSTSVTAPPARAPLSARLPRRSRPDVEETPPSRSSLRLPLAPSYAPPSLLESGVADAPLIADTSSPELELPTPATPTAEDASQETAEASPSSAVSEAGTYTIDADRHTEEQKAKMSIDEAFRLADFDEPIGRALRERDTTSMPATVTRGIREELLLAGAAPEPIGARRTGADRNVLEVSYRYESPAGSADTSIEEPAPKPSPRREAIDAGSFTSVTASGVLGAPSRPKTAVRSGTRDNLVLQNVANDSFTPDETPERAIVEGLSRLSLDRCRGDKSWIREWADSVKRHNRESGLPPIAPKGVPSPTKSSSSACASPGEMPSPASTLLRRRPPVPDILTSTPDTESYLQNTQNLISNLQAKLRNAESTPLSRNGLRDKFNSSKLPVSQLNRSNSLNYRLYRKHNSAENSPLRNCGNYLVTGALGSPSGGRLSLSCFGASKSLDTDPNISPIRDISRTGTHSRHHSFDGRNLHRRFYSPDRSEDDFNNANMTRSLNLKFSGANAFEYESKANSPRPFVERTTRNISSPSNGKFLNVKYDRRHRSGDSDAAPNEIQNSITSSKLDKEPTVRGSPIRRSSSFNIMNKNNNIYDSSVKHLVGSPVPRISTICKTRNYRNHHEKLMQTSCDFPLRNNTPEMDCVSEDSDNLSTGGFYSDYDRKRSRKSDVDFLAGARCNRAFALRRARLESPDARTQRNGSPMCPSTPETGRKNSIDTNKRPARSHSRESRTIGSANRMTDVRPDVCQVSIVDTNKPQKSKKNEQLPKQNVSNRLTRSTSSAKELIQKSNEKSSKKIKSANQVISSKEIELSNWKKRSSYDPMKAALEGKKNKLLTGKVKPNDLIPKVEDINSPSNSSPVHRSRSFNCTNTPVDERIYLLQQSQVEISSDTSDLEDRLICTLPADGSNKTPVLKMISGTDISKLSNVPDITKRIRPAQNHKIKLSSDYVTKLQIDENQKKSSFSDRRRTYILDDNKHHDLDCPIENDKRRTIILDSDTTNSTTNGSSSRRNSSIYSDDRVNNEHLSDSEGESDTEPITNVIHRVKSKSVPPQQRHSGDFSMSSSTCSTSKDPTSSKKTPIQPRYLDISRYKSSENTTKNFLRKDPSKTYVGVLPSAEHRQSRKNTAKQLEQEQKNRELEKWKRRASYDPRKSAAQAKLKPTTTKSPSSSVLRSQSFHGPMMQTTKLSIITTDNNYPEAFYQDLSSDNEF